MCLLGPQEQELLSPYTPVPTLRRFSYQLSRYSLNASYERETDQFSWFSEMIYLGSSPLSYDKRCTKSLLWSTLFYSVQVVGGRWGVLAFSLERHEEEAMGSITGRMWQLLQLQISEPIVRTRSVWIEFTDLEDLTDLPQHTVVVRDNAGCPRRLSIVHGHKVSGRRQWCWSS